jgi:tetratricopeptide (TPR) repeat protein
MEFDVFMSYSSKDKSIADAVCAGLENEKIRCWMAPRDVLPGTPYAEALIEAIDDCTLMVLVFSENSNTSPQVQREVERAVAKGKAIIPFRIKDVPMTKSMEYYLSVPHWLDALTPPMEKHLRRLCETVSSMLAKTGQAGRGDERTSRRAAPEGSSSFPPVEGETFENIASLFRRAMSLAYQHDYDGAMACYEEVERYCRSKGDILHLAITIKNQALVLQEKGSWEDALARRTEEAELWGKLGDDHRLQECLGGIAKLLARLGQPRMALEVLRKREEILRRSNDDRSRLDLAKSLAWQADILFELEGPKDALPLAETAYAMASDPANKSTPLEKLAIPLSKLLEKMKNGPKAPPG